MLLTLLLVAFLLLDGLLLLRRSRYREETERLRAGMTALDQQRADAILAADAEKSALMLEVLQRQAQGDGSIHLAVNTDSGYVALDRGAARLRTMPARIGPERRGRSPSDTVQVVVPRGVRSIEALLGPTDRFALPAWLWTDRGLEPPTVRDEVGWTGPQAIVTSGGTLIYALPDSGPLADSSFVMPGAVRLDRQDLRAVRENLARGTRVYFF
jgi:hypothetical protein